MKSYILFLSVIFLGCSGNPEKTNIILQSSSVDSGESLKENDAETTQNNNPNIQACDIEELELDDFDGGTYIRYVPVYCFVEPPIEVSTPVIGNKLGLE